MSKYVGRIITDQAPAGYSVYFDGTGDYLTVADSAALDFGTGDFTIEAWVYPTANNTFSGVLSKSTDGGTDGLTLNIDNGTLVLKLGTTSYTGSTVSLNTWSHVAATRSGTSVRVFLNGAQVASGTDSYNTDTNGNFRIGAARNPANADNLLTGYISNARAVKGTALYTAAFTPPTQLLNVTNTSILTCNSPAIVDQSSNAFAITTNGNAAVSTFTSFTAYNPAPTSSNPLTPAPGVWSLDEALQYTQQGVWPSYPANAIEDVFSTYLYTGDSTNRSIVNNIDLSGKGGLVWIKDRNAGLNHTLFDTARGATKYLFSDSTNSEGSASNTLTAFNSNGFSLGTNSGYVNGSGYTYASWTFREQAKFFDVVTYTGNGSNRTIAHNLGSVPGCIIVKAYSGGSASGCDWAVYHRSTGNTGALWLNQTNAFPVASGSTYWNNTTPTSTDFTVSTNVRVNESGTLYVAYLFAHDAGGFGATGTDNVISCGSFTTDGSGNATVNLGYEPQWVLIKASSTTSSWVVIDNMRGFSQSQYAYLLPNTSGVESSSTTTTGVIPTATGFTVGSNFSAPSTTYIYIAIRRGPMRPPTSGTSVFSTSTYSPNTGTITSGFPTDFIMTLDRATGTAPWNRGFADRLRGRFLTLSSASSGSENTNTSTTSFDSNTGTILNGGGVYGSSYVYEQFRRAPGFFDVVCYTGTGSATTFNHNLAAVPEMMIVKSRNNATNWAVYCAYLGGTNPANRYVLLNSSNSFGGTSVYWNDTAPTSTVFTVGTTAATNTSSYTYVNYLFATVAGVSKVGSYTGSGTTKQIDCGFTAGARFVMIKRTDSTGDWYVWDTARGIVAGNDPYLLLNNTNAEVTNTDFVDTYSLGFELSSTAPADLNASGGSYIFLAIA